MSEDIRPDPTILFIFGAGGDLTWRKLVPALYNLFLDEYLPEQFALIGIDKKDMSEKDFAKRLRDGVNKFSRRGKAEDEQWKAFAENIHSFISADFGELDGFKTMDKTISELEDEWEADANRIYYLATPPGLVETITNQLGKAKLAKNKTRSRMVVEKPFGSDYDSAHTLNEKLLDVFDESQIYRIDHYLGKETVQNILAFRFANALFEPLWDRRYIDHVQITVGESVGVEHRGDYYDQAGALRDMVQNHLLQILCLIAMEPPVSFDADEIRNKKLDLLRAIHKFPDNNIKDFAVRGQYGSGWIEGEKVQSYHEEPGVDTDSGTETFAALKLFIDNWRWQDVPFYMRTGKRLPKKVSEVAIQFKPVPHQSFPSTALEDWQPNRLVIHIQPQESITLRFQAKQPGPIVTLSSVDMEFNYRETFKATPPEAYETLLLDVMQGDATLFMRADQVEAAWKTIMPVLNAWQQTRQVNFPNYRAGSWGPESAIELIAKDGRSWMLPTVMEEDAEESED